MHQDTIIFMFLSNECTLSDNREIKKATYVCYPFSFFTCIIFSLRCIYSYILSNGCWLFQDKRVKQLKRELEGWREVILPLNSILLWEKNWYPGMLVGITTVFFL
jgi:hypothetical protein